MTLPQPPKPRSKTTIGYMLPNGSLVTYEYDTDRPIAPDPRHGANDWTTPEGRAAEQRMFDHRMDQFGIKSGPATQLTWFTRTSLTTYSDYQPIGEDS